MKPITTATAVFCSTCFVHSYKQFGSKRGVANSVTPRFDIWFPTVLYRYQHGWKPMTSTLCRGVSVTYPAHKEAPGFHHNQVESGRFRSENLLLFNPCRRSLDRGTFHRRYVRLLLLDRGTVSHRRFGTASRHRGSGTDQCLLLRQQHPHQA